MSSLTHAARHARTRLTLTALEDRATPAVAYAVTPDNALIRFNTDSPGLIQRSVPLTGLQGGDRVVGIDIRASTGQVYAVAVRDTPGPDEGRAYRVETDLGTCTLLGGPFSTTLADGAAYGVEVDPVRDTLRVVNGAGQNLEVSITDGSLVRTGVALHTNSGATPSVVAIAYTGGPNPGTHPTLELLGIDTATSSFARFGGITSDEDLGLVNPTTPLGVNPANGNIGFDYVRTLRVGFATIPTASGTVLYRIDLGTGGPTATLVGLVGSTTSAGLNGFALVPFTPVWAVGAGAGGGPQVNVYASDGSLVRAFNAYDPSFRGGVRVATADLTGGGTPGVVTAPGPGGGPHVRVFDGATGALVREWMAYDPSFRGGVFVAAGDVTGDGVPDVVTGAGPGGGPHVKVFDGVTGALVREWMAYDPAFRGGVTVAAGDVDGDGVKEVITGAGPGGGPHVKVFDGRAGTERLSFLAYDPAFRGGVFVASGNAHAHTDVPVVEDIITAPGPGGGPHVEVFDGLGRNVLSFLAFDPAFTGGVTVGGADLNGDGRAEVIIGAGPGGGPHVKVFAAPELAVRASVLAFDPAFTGGVFVG